MVYDRVVLGIVAMAVWRCPTSRLVAGYRRHIHDRHLDVGPGTGYFLARSGLPPGSRVTILDPNPNVLEHAARRLQHLDLTVVEADVLKPLPVDGPFDSAALHLVIHCLPGPLARKADAVANVAAILEPTGVLFGATVLGSAGPQTRPSRCSPRSTGGARSTTWMTPKKGSARSSGPRSNTWKSRPLAPSRSSRRRTRGLEALTSRPVRSPRCDPGYVSRAAH